MKDATLRAPSGWKSFLTTLAFRVRSKHLEQCTSLQVLGHPCHPILQPWGSSFNFLKSSGSCFQVLSNAVPSVRNVFLFLSSFWALVQKSFFSDSKLLESIVTYLPYLQHLPVPSESYFFHLIHAYERSFRKHHLWGLWPVAQSFHNFSLFQEERELKDC